MKKYFTSNDYKRQNTKRAESRLKQRLLSEERKKAKRRSISGADEDKKDNKRISPREFSERLYNYLWIPKVSELIIILYLEDLKDITPTIYEINKLLRRTTNQYSVTFKSVKKLEDLDIIFTKTIKGSNRKQKQIYIKKDVVKIYGDDEFRQMMLNEWDIDAKVYIKRKLNWLLKEKEKVENRIKMIKKSRRYMGDKNDE